MRLLVDEQVRRTSQDVGQRNCLHGSVIEAEPASDKVTRVCDVVPRACCAPRASESAHVHSDA